MLKVYRMRVLALDTTGRAGSVALVEDGRILLEKRGDASRSHGERLPGELAALGAPFSSIAVVDCEECGALVRSDELFGSKIRRARRCRVV